MNLLANLSVLFSVCAFGYLLLGVRLLCRDREIGNVPIGITFLVIGAWVLGGAIEIVTGTYVGFSIARVGHFMGTAIVPISILLCFREFTGKVTSTITVVALLIIPVFSFIVAATNYWHEFMWQLPVINAAGEFLTRPQMFGPWFKYVHAPFAYTVIGISIITLIMHSTSVAPAQRRGLFVLAGSAFVPLLAIIAYDLNIGPNTISTLPIVFSVMLPIYSWMVVGDGVVDFTPLAYETVFQKMQDPVIVVDDKERIISLNHGAELLLKLSESEAIHQPLRNVFGNEANEVHTAIESGKPQKMLTETGRFLHVQVTPIAASSAISSNANVLMFRDVSDVEKAQQEVLNSERLLRTLIDHSVNGVIRLRWADGPDPDGPKELRCIFANAAAGRYLNAESEQMTNYTAAKLLELATTGLDEDVQTSLQERFMDAADRGEMIDFETRVETAGIAKWLRMIGEPVGNDVAMTFVDVTDGKAKEEEMESIAKSDPLTGVLNRRGFERDAALRLTQSADDATGALLFIDLNDFKPINDQFGHDVGDQLLIVAAERLQKSLRSCDVIGRPGGDEFVALVPDVRVDVAEKLGARLTKSLEQPYRIDNKELHCSASIGLALYPLHANTLTGLLRAADAAMYRAKARSRNVTSLGSGELLEKAG